MVGGSITIPMDISVLDTTRSIIRKGINIRNPMVNALFSSLRIKEGTMVVRPSFIYPSCPWDTSGGWVLDMDRKRSRLFFSVCFSMNSFMGSCARTKASSLVIRPSRYGW